jgi:hypothetical protein
MYIIHVIIYCCINGTKPVELHAITANNISAFGTTTINIAWSPYDFKMARQGLKIKAGI